METKQLIREIVEKQGVTRYRIAKELGVTPGTVYRWESGEKRPNMPHLMELLRRAGRLAAMVLIVSGVGGVSMPQDAAAMEAQKSRPIYTLCEMLRRGMRAIRHLLLNAGRLPATALAF